MIPHQEAEKPKQLEMKMILLDGYWLRGMIGDVTYLRSMFIAGLLPDEANTRLNLLRMDKAERRRG